MYATSMLALFRLRKTEPDMSRPFRIRMYPFAPLWTLLGVTVCLASVVYYNRLIAAIFLGTVIAGYLLLRVTGRAATERNIARG
jgi:ethanolamine permease